jgi:hypothetical protein
MASRKSPQQPTRFEVAARRIDEAARSLIESETAQRHAKVARLKSARLARDAAEAEVQAAAPPKKRRAATAKADKA